MDLQKLVPLSTVYRSETEFSSDLAKNLNALKEIIGSFEDAETESDVGARRADIVAVHVDEEDGTRRTLVVENQFGRADWDHWGRLEAYARLKEADVAALIAEEFEELMIVTCNLRNEDSEIDWYLIEAHANTHREIFFYPAARPAIDIQIRSQERRGYSEFWEPIRREGLFAGKPVPVRYEDGGVWKSIRGISVGLEIRNHHAQVRLGFRGDDRVERRAKVAALFPATDYKYELQESPLFATIVFPVIDKGKKDKEHWPEIHTRLTDLGTDIYRKIDESTV